MGRQAKFKVVGKKNALLTSSIDGEKSGYGVIAQGEKGEEPRRTFCYI